MLQFPEAVQAVPFLRALGGRDLERLRPYGACRELARGDTVWSCGQPSAEFTFLVSGRVKLAKACDAGREVIVGVCSPGVLLCVSAVCSFAPHCCRGVALEDGTAVVAFPRRDLLALLEASPSASLAFLREVTGRELPLIQRIEELSSGHVERRIATLFLRLASQVGVTRATGETWVGLQLSRQDLADMTGTTLETAIRVMGRLARQGLLRSTGRGFVVPDRVALEQVARPR